MEGRDQGIWRRIRLIPFEVEIAEEKQDAKLLDKLLEEGEEILAWAIRGCLDWQNDGLGLPVAVKEASQAYREEQTSSVDFSMTAVFSNLVIKPRLVYCIKPFETGASATEKKVMRPTSSAPWSVRKSNWTESEPGSIKRVVTFGKE